MGAHEAKDSAGVGALPACAAGAGGGSVQCVGDCNHDPEVSIDELLNGVHLQQWQELLDERGEP
jgi:hypothetical protein